MSQAGVECGIGRIYTSGQIARICKVAPRTASKWMDSGKLKGYRIPTAARRDGDGKGDRRCTHQALVAFMKEYDMPMQLLDGTGTNPAKKAIYIGLEGDFRASVRGYCKSTLDVPGSLFVAGMMMNATAYSVMVVDLAIGTGEAAAAIAAIRKRMSRQIKIGAILSEGCDDSVAAALSLDAAYRRPCNPAEVARWMDKQVFVWEEAAPAILSNGGWGVEEEQVSA